MTQTDLLELPSREDRMARNWGRPPTHSQWGTNTLSPKTHEELDPTSNQWESSEADPSPVMPGNGTVSLADTLFEALGDPKLKELAKPCPDSSPT